MVARRRGNKKTRRSNSRRMRRVASRRRSLRGGAPVYSPASVDDNSMNGPAKMSLSQGVDYGNNHSAQHGGAAVSLANAAPPGYTGMLDDSLRSTARIAPLDESMSAISGMSDNQAGGNRNGPPYPTTTTPYRLRTTTPKKGKENNMNNYQGGRRRSRRGKKASRKGKKASRRSMRGGSAYSLANAADAGAPGVLLSPAQEATALKGMHSDWKSAGDVTLYTPSR